VWGKEKNKKVDFDSHAGKTTMVAKGTRIRGDIIFDGGLLVEGIIIGDIYADVDSDSLLRLSETASVEGDIHVPNMVINGKVTGNVFSSGHLELAAKGVVNGDVHYSLVEMIVGSEVNGALVHDQLESAVEQTKKTAQTPQQELIPAKGAGKDKAKDSAKDSFVAGDPAKSA